MHRNKLILIIISVFLGVVSNSIAALENHLNSNSFDGTVETYYRGQRVTAMRYGDLLLLEGDILISEKDRYRLENQPAITGTINDQYGVIVQGLAIQGRKYQWPLGTDSNNPDKFVIPYDFPVARLKENEVRLEPNQQAEIVRAMRDWSEAVPTLLFRQATNNDIDKISFIGDRDRGNCSSHVGRIGGSQKILLGELCFGNFTAHHEIGHALGLYHQHTRKDRNTFITINWANIRGCLNTATGSGTGNCGNTLCAVNAANLASCGCTLSQATGTGQPNNRPNCDMSGNFTTNNLRSNIGLYDYDSVMHYPNNGFSKGGQTITPVVARNPNGIVIGQTNHLSVGDIKAVRAMYPSVVARSVVFRNTGAQQLCRLQGREEDIAVKFDMESIDIPNESIRIPDNCLTADGYLHTDGLNDFDHSYLINCQVQSVFWDDNYDYPNKATPFNSSKNVEKYSLQKVWVQTLNPGLIIPTVLAPIF